MNSISAFAISAFQLFEREETGFFIHHSDFRPLPLPPALLHSSFCLLPFTAATIGRIEKLTGMNFLPKLSTTKRTAMENFKAPALWPKE